MPNTPYPGYSPNYRQVPKIGGFDRTCYVLELRTLGEMDPIRRAMLEDAIGVAVAKFQEVESFDIVRSDRFDTDLRHAMRL